MKPARRAQFEQAVGHIRSLLAGEEVKIDSGVLRLKHAPGRHLPIVIAASGPRVLELAGRIADGIIMLVGTIPGPIGQAIERVRVGAAAAGRRVEAIHLILWVPCAVSDDSPARDAVKAHVARVVAHPLPFPLDAEE